MKIQQKKDEKQILGLHGKMIRIKIENNNLSYIHQTNGDFIKQKLIETMAKTLIEQKLICFTKTTNLENFSECFYATCYLLPQENVFALITDLQKEYERNK